MAALVWAVSAVDLVRHGMPPPLRPLLAIHLAPAALFATVSAMLGLPQLAFVASLAMLALLALLLFRARWIAVAGFSPMWGAFTFPAAAAASACLAQGAEPFRSLGGLLVIAATLTIPPIAWKVLQLWARGRLGPATNAAVA